MSPLSAAAASKTLIMRGMTGYASVSLQHWYRQHMHRTQENMIWEVEDDLESSNLDSVGALDLSSFKPGAGEGFKLTELCEVCSDKASGRNIF